MYGGGILGCVGERFGRFGILGNWIFKCNFMYLVFMFLYFYYFIKIIMKI